MASHFDCTRVDRDETEERGEDTGDTVQRLSPPLTRNRWEVICFKTQVKLPSPTHAVSDLGALDVAVRGHAAPPQGVRLGREGPRRESGHLRRRRQRRRRQSQQRAGVPRAHDGD